MSGITPLLDTLLHQVLGRRAERQATREATPPVEPLTPAQAARAPNSDSRLDARGPRPLTPVSARNPAPAAPPSPPAAAASTATRLSPAARAIAEVLQTYPAQPSAITPAAPLLAADALPDAPVLASLLRRSIIESGLFYEAHLARWYRGELPLPALAREPQMSGWLPPPQEETPSQRLLSGMQPVMPVSAMPSVGEGATEVTASAGGTSFLDTAQEAPEDFAPAAASALSQKGLQGIVRHQLELLVSPTLRWEGEVWAGLFMNLLLQAPAAEQTARGRNNGEAVSAVGEQAEWGLQLDLELPRYGPLRLDVRLSAQSLSLTMVSASDVLIGHFAETRDALRERLLLCGLSEARLRCQAARQSPENGNE